MGGQHGIKTCNHLGKFWVEFNRLVSICDGIPKGFCFDISLRSRHKSKSHDQIRCARGPATVCVPEHGL